jgi:hypothetical protein
LPALHLPFLEPHRPRFRREVGDAAYDRFDISIDRVGNQYLQLVRDHVFVCDGITEPQHGFDRRIIRTRPGDLASGQLQSLRFEQGLSHAAIAHDRIIEHKRSALER